MKAKELVEILLEIPDYVVLIEMEQEDHLMWRQDKVDFIRGYNIDAEAKTITLSDCEYEEIIPDEILFRDGLPED